MAVTYKTPGAYVEELNAFPASIVPVSTAVPAFAGYTSQAVDSNGDSLLNVPKKVSSLLDYQTYFGAGPSLNYSVSVTADRSTNPTTYIINEVEKSGDSSLLLYYAIQHYFLNGGGPCYIVSVGVGDGSGTTPSKNDLLTGLTALEAEDEPTLLVVPEATVLSSSGFNDVCQQMLAQCSSLKDRFSILDVLDGDVDSFRDGIVGSDLSYGCAYTPYLKTSINEIDSGNLNPDRITVNSTNLDGTAGYTWEQEGCLAISYDGSSSNPVVVIDGGVSDSDVTFTVTAETITISNVHRTIKGQIKKATQSDTESSGEGKLARSYTGDQLVKLWAAWNGDHGDFTMTASKHGKKAIRTTEGDSMTAQASSQSLSNLQASANDLYNQIVSLLTARTMTLPPSAAIAGVYCQTDGNIGVWKAPANVGLMSVIGPVEKITNADQEDLNVDSSGKSINAIRAFNGKGTLVWGARTLLGNDENWRYINVRRLFIYMEESIVESTAWAVFEPNVKITWLKVQASIENFLYGLWQQGALAGSTPQEAYFVNVGLGTTMTEDDVLNGRLNVTVGAAPSRPAEFITVTFTQILQQA